MAALAPMASASVAIAPNVNSGVRRRLRTPGRRSLADARPVGGIPSSDLHAIVATRAATHVGIALVNGGIHRAPFRASHGQCPWCWQPRPGGPVGDLGNCGKVASALNTRA
jgi:hypothetical protein